MTELEAALHFATHCSRIYPALKRDIDKLSKIIKYVKSGKCSEDYLDSLIRTLLSYADALVFGLNSRRLVFNTNVLSMKPACSYPKFLSGLTALVFHDNGILRDNWDRKAFEFLLQILAFFKRFKHKSLRSRADASAKREFIAYQSMSRPFDESVAYHLRQFWNYFVRDFEKHSTIGFPGPGATLDEMHPYAPNYSFVNTWDKYLPDECRLFYDKCFSNHTGFPDARSWFLYSGKDKILPQFYLVHPNPILSSVCVPKNSKVSRMITITHVGNTILGASYRNTIKSLWRAFGITDKLNVDDQTKSHRTLELYFNDVACLDLEGGSSCFTNSLNSAILPDVLQDFLDYVSNSSFEVDDEVYPVTTQLMGDSISTALLTTSLYLIICLAQFYHDHRDKIRRYNDALDSLTEYTFHETRESMFRKAFKPTKAEIIRVMDIVKGLPVNVVGDDVIIPKHLEQDVRDILRLLGITVNNRKSSSADSNHKESCGAWFIRGEGNKPYRIYPFRFPEGDTKPLRYQSATQFLKRTANSSFSLELTLTLSEVYGDELENESFNSDQIGSPVGWGYPATITQKVSQEHADVSDGNYYHFIGTASSTGMPRREESSGDFHSELNRLFTRNPDTGHQVAFRNSKRAPVARTRYTAFVDKIKRDTDRYEHMHAQWVRYCLGIRGLRRDANPTFVFNFLTKSRFNAFVVDFLSAR